MKTVALRRVASIVNGGTPTPDPAFWGGDVPWVTPVDMARVDGGFVGDTDRTLTPLGVARGSALTPPGSVLLSCRAPIGYTALAEIAASFNQGCKALVPAAGVLGRYLQYTLIAAKGQLAALGSGSTFLELSSESLASLPVPRMATERQQRIADFLDDRVARLDRIIAARQSQLESNREHLRSVVEEVFDGHVERVRASRVMRVLPGFAFPSDEFSHDDGDVPLLRGINVGVGSLRWDDLVYWPHERLSEVQGFLLSEGDVVLGMDRPWIGGGLRIAQLDRSDGRPLLLQRVAKLSSDGYLSPRFIFWAYQSEQFRQQVESDLTGLSVPHLSGDQILSYQIPALSRSDQRWATDRLDAAQSAVASAGQLLVRSIALLAEYKQSLITAAVTGEFDVTTAGSGIPG